MSSGVGCRRSSDPAWLWLWCRLAAAVLIKPLAWEPPYAADVALKSQKKKKIMTPTQIRTQIDAMEPQPSSEDQALQPSCWPFSATQLWFPKQLTGLSEHLTFRLEEDMLGPHPASGLYQILRPRLQLSQLVLQVCHPLE